MVHIQPSNEVSYAELIRLWDTCKTQFETKGITGEVEGAIADAIGYTEDWDEEGTSAQ